MNILQTKINKDEFINEIYPNHCKGFDYIPAILKSVHRIIVLGDIHGDYNLLIKMLQIANLIKLDKYGHILWIGGDTYVVQVGDQIDRCRPVGNMLCTNPQTTYNDEASDIKILKLCTDLHHQALLQKGAFISLLGNHEIMNSLGIMSYVSYLGLKEFENYIDPYNLDAKFASGLEARIYAFAPKHGIGKMLGCTRLPAVIVGSHLFVHAGIIDALIQEIGLSGIYDLETINIAVRMWLIGVLKKKYIKKIIRSSEISMFWTRILGNIPPNVSFDNPICQQHISKVLKLFKVNGIIIGHTPQSFTYSDDINVTCDSIWRVDNGSSQAFQIFDRQAMQTGKILYSRRAQILEIIDDKEYYILDGVTRRKIK